MKPQPAAQQQTLARPVCLQANGIHICVLLKGHDGKHVGSKGVPW